MTSMTVYDIQVIYKDKTVVMDKSGPYYGSYLEDDPALDKRCEEILEDANVLTVIVNSSSEMA